MSSLVRLGLLSLLVITGCSKEQDDDSFPRVEGISKTSYDNNQLGPRDENDWLFYEPSDKKLSLFYSIPGARYDCPPAEDSLISMGTAYPNPCTNGLFLHVGKAEDYNMDLRVVDSNHKLMRACDSIAVKYVQLDVNDLKKGQIYRIYYRINSPGCSYFGHRDFIKN